MAIDFKTFVAVAPVKDSKKGTLSPSHIYNIAWGIVFVKHNADIFCPIAKFFSLPFIVVVPVTRGPSVLVKHSLDAASTS